MSRLLRTSIQSILKLVNSFIGMTGMAMILYSIWLIRVCERDNLNLPVEDSHHALSWFIYTFLGLGLTLCLITCSGHVAAATANGCCLYIYMAFMILLLMLEAGVITDVFLNREWEKDFPVDQTGSFNMFKDFIRSNFEFCKGVGLCILVIQGLCVVLAMLLKAIGPYRYYESDDDMDTDTDTMPLLKKDVHQTYAVCNA